VLSFPLAVGTKLEAEPRASISQDYWGDIKEDWRSGDGSPPAGSTGGTPVGSLGDEVPQKLKVFL